MRGCLEGGQGLSLGHPSGGWGGYGGKRGHFSPAAQAWRAEMALHRLQLGLSEECLLSFSEKLGALGPCSSDSQPPGSAA